MNARLRDSASTVLISPRSSFTEASRSEASRVFGQYIKIMIDEENDDTARCSRVDLPEQLSRLL